MIISKLSEYTSFVEELPNNFSLSRGQAGDFPLLPSALRKDLISNTRKYTKRAIRNFLEQFKINSYQFMTSPWDVKNDIEWMLYAQHFGVPTKLMDFTTSHLTSLLFALENAFQSSDDQDAVVYFLDPAALNQQNMQQSKIVNVSGDSKIVAEGYDGPVVIQGRKMNSRVNAQKGLFVLYQDDDDPLEQTVGEQIMCKVTIRGEATKEILASLYSMGIGFTHIYPELSSVAKDILLQEDINDFLREKE